MNLKFTGKFEKYEVLSLRDEIIYFEEHSKYDIERIFKLTEPLCKDYPKHKEWFYEKHLANIKAAYMPHEHRDILYIHEPTDYIPDSLNVIGAVCLKKTPYEKKICCLCVDEHWRNKGIGTLLLQCSFKWLGTNTPLITCLDYKLEEIQPLAKKFGWKLEETLDDPYGTGHKELCFNGKLVKDPEPKREQISIDHILKLKNDKSK